MSLLRRALQAATRGSSARRGAAIADDVLSGMRAPAPRRQYAGSQEGPVGALIGAGRAKKVYEHPTNADAVVVRIASPSDMDLALIEFAQAAHAQRLPMAAHLPRVGNLSRNADGSLSYEAERLAHQQGARSVSLGRDRAVTADGGWYVRGLPEGDPQSASLRATMDAMNRHLQGRVSGRFYGDAHSKNVMVSRDGRLILNDPFEWG